MEDRHRPQATFFKQAILIVPPIVILSAIALYSLRQDKALVEQEAREQARILAPELARQWSRRVGEELAGFLAAQSLRGKPVDLPRSAGGAAGDRAGSGSPQEPGVKDPLKREYPGLRAGELPQLQCLLINGRIRSPADYPPLPTPPDWPNKLAPEQLRMWQTAEEALFQDGSADAARRAVAAMTAAAAPRAARANAEFSLLLLETGRGAATDVPGRLADLAGRYPEVVTESGTPLADLALIQALRRSVSGRLSEGLLPELARRVLEHPSFLTPELLDAAERISADSAATRAVQALRSVWLAEEEALSLLRRLLQHRIDPVKPSPIWLDAEDQPYLALCSPIASAATGSPVAIPAACHVTLIPGRLLEEAFLTALSGSPGQVPAYAAAVVQVGDRSWTIAAAAQIAARTSGPRSDELGSAVGQLEVQPELADRSVVALAEDLSHMAHQTIPDRRQISGGPIRLAGFPSSYPFTISLELARPDLLFARYRQGLWLAAGLVLSAAAAALIGLVSAWHAFRRQLRLAEVTSNFVSSVSHELRAPIASVRLMAEGLERGSITDDERQKGYFRLMVQECRRLSSLVENVLDFSRMHQGRKRYEFESINLEVLIRQTVTLMEPNAGERQVGLLLFGLPVGGEELQPCWDGQAIQQALVNLIDNAIKHSPAGAVVKIGLEVVEGAAESPVGVGATPLAAIRLSVEDQGQGIPPEEQERIFEPFYRRGSELRRETKGVGIGLSIVKHVAEAHGGRVLVQSIVGQGSRFTLDLPFTLGPENGSREAETRAADGIERL